ncbi:MAG TPA: FtsX-like permease family protein [Rectinemataceae bacterium]|nr:FtsX-like permease family protein [Rectinemataceae bacterium]
MRYSDDAPLGLVPLLLASARRRLGDAALLFASTTFAVVSLTIFVAAGSSPRFQDAQGAYANVRGVFNAASVVIAFFAVGSGWFYAEHYLLGRKREIASWILLGMRRSKAAGILSLELGVASLASFVAGLGLGALFLRLFSFILAAMMSERRAVPLQFGVSCAAIAFAACAGQWLVASLRAVLDVYRTNLATLFRAKKEPEAKLRSGFFGAAAGLALIGAGYGIALFWKGASAGRFILPVLVSTVAGSFFLFSSLLPAWIAASRKKRALAADVDAAGLVAWAQVSFRSRRNYKVYAFGAVLVATAATALGAVVTLDARDDLVARHLCPQPLELTYQADGKKAGLAAAASIDAFLGADARRMEISSFRAKVYVDGEAVRTVRVFPLSTWTPLALALGEKTPALGSGKAGYSDPAENGGKTKYASIQLRAGEKVADVDLLPGESLPPLSIYASGASVLLDDEGWGSLRGGEDGSPITTTVAWTNVSPERQREAAAAFSFLVENESKEGPWLVVRASVLEEQAGIYGVLKFIGALLAATFILAALSSIAFRAIEDARDDADRYHILLELGAEDGVVGRSLAIQNALAFGLPLVLGLCHTAAALRMLTNMSGYASAASTAAVSAGTVVAFVVAWLAATGSQSRMLRNSGRFRAE